MTIILIHPTILLLLPPLSIAAIITSSHRHHHHHQEEITIYLSSSIFAPFLLLYLFPSIASGLALPEYKYTKISVFVTCVYKT